MRILHFIQILLIFTLMLCCANVEAQEEIIENNAEPDNEFEGHEDALQDLQDLLDSPININTASANELIRIRWISPRLAKEIVSHRAVYGAYTYIKQLLEVESMTPDLYEQIRPYLTIEKKPPENMFGFASRARAVHKLEQDEALKNGTYENSPLSIYQKMEIHIGPHWYAGILTDKDAGELKFNDFLSQYIQYQSNENDNTVIVGNFRVEAGQGLTLWGPYGRGKGSDPTAFINNRSRGLRPYGLVDENASLFGIGIQKCLKIYQILLFYSHQNLDASADSSSVTKNLHVSGYHRTDSEKNGQDSITEVMTGARIQIQATNNIRFGTTGYLSRYSSAIGSDDYIRKQFDFRGTQNSVIGFDYDISIHHLGIFGEVAQSRSTDWGMISGALIHEAPVTIALVHRHYGKQFHSLHGVRFGSFNGAPQNETGTYFGFNYRISHRYSLSAYFDLYRFPWRSYYITTPSGGKEALLHFRARVLPSVTIAVQSRLKQRWLEADIGDQQSTTAHIFEPETRRYWRFQLEYRPAKRIKLRSRIETSIYEHAHEQRGFLMYQDIRFRLSNKLTVYSRLSFFDTDDWASRIYQFENDVPFVLTNKPLHGQGNRWYICFNYKPIASIRLSGKYEATNYDRIKKTASYSDPIEGKSQHLFRGQLEISFNN